MINISSVSQNCKVDAKNIQICFVLKSLPISYTFMKGIVELLRTSRGVKKERLNTFGEEDY